MPSLLSAVPVGCQFSVKVSWSALLRQLNKTPLKAVIFVTRLSCTIKNQFLAQSSPTNKVKMLFDLGKRLLYRSKDFHFFPIRTCLRESNKNYNITLSELHTIWQPKDDQILDLLPNNKSFFKHSSILSSSKA